MTLPFDAVAQIRSDGGALIDLVRRHDAVTAVPSCPDWSLADLCWHVAEVWEFWATIVADRITAIDDVRAIPELDRPADDAALVEFAELQLERLCDVLSSTPTDAAVWTWTGASRDVEWVQRRMAQETAMHRWDAAITTGTHHEIPMTIAADGIDEFLMWHAAASTADGAPPVGGSVHLHCTDTPDGAGEWFVERLDESGATFTREHRKGDAAVRGPSHALLLWLWRRSDAAIEIIGDQGVAERFHSTTDLE